MRTVVELPELVRLLRMRRAVGPFSRASCSCSTRTISRLVRPYCTDRTADQLRGRSVLAGPSHEPFAEPFRSVLRVALAPPRDRADRVLHKFARRVERFHLPCFRHTFRLPPGFVRPLRRVEAAAPPAGRQTGAPLFSDGGGGSSRERPVSLDYTAAPGTAPVQSGEQSDIG